MSAGDYGGFVVEETRRDIYYVLADLMLNGDHMHHLRCDPSLFAYQLRRQYRSEKSETQQDRNHGYERYTQRH